MADNKMADGITATNCLEDLNEKLCVFLDENVKDDLSNVHEFLVQMKERKLDLENQLKSSDVSEVTPSCVDQTLKEASDILRNVDKTQFNLNNLNSRVEEHCDDVASLINQLERLNDSVRELDNLSCYIKWIQKVEDISTMIYHDLEPGSLKKASENLLEMRKISDVLGESSCTNLKTFITKTLNHWFRILLEKLTKEFEDVLKILKWPFTSGSTTPPLTVKPDVFKRLENLFIILYKISEIGDMTMNNGDQISTTNPRVTLPLKLLITPLSKRFLYHFSSNRQTNNLEKPEWFFTQIVNWVRDHEDFLHSVIQPIIDRCTDCSQCSTAQVQFIEGLLELVRHKMEQIIPRLIEDDQIFSHFIDEALLFEQEIRDVYDFPITSDVCLSVLSEEKCFKKWIALEKRYAMENIQVLVSSEKAWCSRYQDAFDVDDLKVPECVETFVSLLLGITDRYRNLQRDKDRLKFLNVQMDLIFFFTSTLEEVMEQNKETPLNSCFLFILNSTNYLTTVLQEWTEQPFFLKLFYEKYRNDTEKNENSEQKMSKRQEIGTNGDFPEDNKHCSDVIKRDDDVIEETSLSSDDVIGGNDDDIEEALLHSDDVIRGTLFDQAIKQLRILQNDMLSTLVKHVLKEFKVKSEAYKKESWHSLPSQKDLVITCLSSTLCEMVIYLRGILGNLKQELVQFLFTKFWKSLATEISDFLFNQVIINCHFNEGGAAQLKFDMHKNLFVLFGQFTKKPENYFKRLKEGIILLNLMSGSALLLKETMECRGSNNDKISSILDEFGIYNLTYEEVDNVFKSRINRVK